MYDLLEHVCHLAGLTALLKVAALFALVELSDLRSNPPGYRAGVCGLLLLAAIGWTGGAA